MEIKIFNTAAEASQFCAQMIADQVEFKKNTTLGVSTGRTMDAVYHNLVKTSLSEKIDYSAVRTFALDEYIGLKADSPYSFNSYLSLHLYEHLNLYEAMTNIPNVFANDLDLECYEYEEKIKSAGGIDLQVLGIGVNGHIGLNEPGSAIDSRTRVVALTSSTLRSNKSLFSDEVVPKTALTMGIGTIMEARKCVLIATGETKSEIIQKFIQGDVNSKVPATALKNHTNVCIILDKAAAKLL